MEAKLIMAEKEAQLAAEKERKAVAIRDVANVLYAACKTDDVVAAAQQLRELAVLDPDYGCPAVVGWAFRRALETNSVQAAQLLLRSTHTKLPQSLVTLACHPPLQDDGLLVSGIAGRCRGSLSPTTLASALHVVVAHRRMGLLRWILDTYGKVLANEKAARAEVKMHMPDDRPRRFGRAGEDADVETQVVCRRLPGVVDLALEHALITGWIDGAKLLIAAGATPYGYMMQECARHNQPEAIQLLSSTTLPQERSWVVWHADAVASAASEACVTALKSSAPTAAAV